MTTTHRHRSVRRLDGANFLLLLVCIVSALVAWALIAHGLNAIVLIPSVLVGTLAATRLVKYEAPHE